MEGGIDGGRVEPFRIEGPTDPTQGVLVLVVVRIADGPEKLGEPAHTACRRRQIVGSGPRSETRKVRAVWPDARCDSATIIEGYEFSTRDVTAPQRN